MDIINEYLNRTRKVVTMYDGIKYEQIRPHVLCKDGFTISVQASKSHYCTPRIDGAVKYEVLANIYKSRKDHKLGEWHVLCDWIEKLPYSELITGNSLADIPICKEIMSEAKRRAKEEEK